MSHARRLTLVVLLALSGACGGRQEAAEHATTSGSSPTGIVATPTGDLDTGAPATPEPVTTEPARPTPTVEPAVPVAGWEGEGIRTLSVQLEFNHSERTADLLEIVSHAVGQIGLELADEADGHLRLDLDGTARSAQYLSAGECFTGARLEGTVRLTAAGMPDLDATLEGGIPTPDLIRSCPEEPADAPFQTVFEIALIRPMAGLFGPASVPYLTDVVASNTTGSADVLRSLWGAAIDVYRALDDDAIAVTSQYEFLDAVLWSMAGVVVGPANEEDRAYIETVRSLLLDYSETDFGFADEDDLEAWRAWLTDRRAESTGVTSISDLRAGDCFDWTEVVLVVSCSRPHWYETYAVFRLPDGEYPNATIDEIVADHCLDAFEAFVGIDYSTSELTFWDRAPTPETWDHGDRLIHCWLGSMDDTKLVGSAKGTRR